VISDFCTFTGGIGDIYVVVEDSHRECKLSQFPVVHDYIRLESAIFRRTHTREIYAVFCFPVMLLQITQMISHHRYVCPPFLQADQDTHANLMYTCLSHAVEAVYTPFEFRLHASRMIRFVICFMVSLLKTDHSIQTMISQFLIFFCFKGHYFNLQVAEIRFCQIQRLGNVGNTCCGRVFTGYEQ